MTTALLFPGQGSQRVGMGRDAGPPLRAARAPHLRRGRRRARLRDLGLCFDGPEDELTLTQHSQPAILATSMAVFRVLAPRRA
jgi:[acyl-carrier-protein] S-malonyltransferase